MHLAMYIRVGGASIRDRVMKHQGDIGPAFQPLPPGHDHENMQVHQHTGHGDACPGNCGLDYTGPRDACHGNCGLDYTGPWDACHGNCGLDYTGQRDDCHGNCGLDYTGPWDA